MFVGNDSWAMILGDNIFHGNGLTEHLKKAINNDGRATVSDTMLMTHSVLVLLNLTMLGKLFP